MFSNASKLNETVLCLDKLLLGSANESTNGKPAVQPCDQTLQAVLRSGLYGQDVITNEELARLLQYFYKAGLVLTIAGFVGSVVNIIMNSRRRLEAYTVYLLGINIGDGVSLLAYLQFVIADKTMASSSLPFLISAFYINTIFGTIFRRGAITLNTLASIERFRALVFPFQRRSDQSKYSRTLVVCTFILTTLGHTTLMLEYNFVQTEKSTWVVKNSVLLEENRDLFLALKNGARFMFVYLPISLSLIINIGLAIALKLHSSQQKLIRSTIGNNFVSKSSKSSSQTKLLSSVRLVLVLTFTFTFLALPATVNVTVSSFSPQYGFLKQYNNLYYVISAVTELLSYPTEAALLLVYILHSGQFRKALVYLLGLHPCGSTAT